MLGWIRSPAVAPGRMPKAEATTGLAPKKASASNLLRVTTAGTQLTIQFDVLLNGYTDASATGTTPYIGLSP
jgi:hypothetical protein